MLTAQNRDMANKEPPFFQPERALAELSLGKSEA